MEKSSHSFLVIAAILQGFLGLCVVGTGILGLFGIARCPGPHCAFDGLWFGIQSAVGIAELLLAMPLAQGNRSAQSASAMLLPLNPILPLLYLVVAGSQGYGHGPELLLLLLVVTLPGSLAALVFLFLERRSATLAYLRLVVAALTIGLLLLIFGILML